MVTKQRVKRDWAHALRELTQRKLSSTEIDRRVNESRGALARRDARPSIAPATTGDYVHEIREQATLDA